MEFMVTWRIELDAETPEAAAREALAIMRDPDSQAQCFDVTRVGGRKTEVVDLFEIDRAV